MTVPLADNTPSQAIRFAMLDAGLLQKGNNPSSEDFAEYMPKLNILANTWQTQGLKLWLQSDLSVPLVADQALYTLGPGGTVNMVRPMRVVQGYYLDSLGNRRPITSLSRDEYTRLSNVITPGAINSYFVDKQLTTLNVYFWNTPDAQAATGTAHPIIQQQIGNVTQLSDQMVFPVEWFAALWWGLADMICGGQPQAIMDRCKNNAMTYFNAINDWDVEDASTTFSPDQRGTSVNSGFR